MINRFGPTRSIFAENSITEVSQRSLIASKECALPESTGTRYCFDRFGPLYDNGVLRRTHENNNRHRIFVVYRAVRGGTRRARAERLACIVQPAVLRPRRRKSATSTPANPGEQGRAAISIIISRWGICTSSSSN